MRHLRAGCLTLYFMMSAQAADNCDLTLAFQQPDERGKTTLPVFQGKAETGSGGVAPLFFVSGLKVNTDGTRISYKVDDPRAKNGAINNILNAMRTGKTIADFEMIAKNNWEPVEETWRVLSSNVIERDTKLHKTGKPCVDAKGYLVSKTADVAIADGFSRDGDCDQSKWLDALTIPALVIPGSSQFQKLGVQTRDFVVAMTLTSPRRIVFGIVGDAGPSDELGEASVAMNRMLNGLPATDVPRNSADAGARFSGPKSILLVFPGKTNRLQYPVTPERVESEVRQRFTSWGGEQRLAACKAQ